MKEKIKKLSRKDKEQLYIQKMTELQRYWHNPIDSDWDFLKNWTDERLIEDIESTVMQLNFERILSIIGIIIKISIIIFIGLGIIGLLIFGIKQIL